MGSRVHRYLAEYSNETDELLARHEFTHFDLAAFQGAFGITTAADPMYDCYEVTPETKEFISGFTGTPIAWDFNGRSYYVEAEAG